MFAVRNGDAERHRHRQRHRQYQQMITSPSVRPLPAPWRWWWRLAERIRFGGADSRLCGLRCPIRRSRTWWRRLPGHRRRIDFAGGTVVHINAASAGLVGAYLIGKLACKRGLQTAQPADGVYRGVHPIYRLVRLFNAGSASAANGIAARILNTVVATAGAILSRPSPNGCCAAFRCWRLLRHDRRLVAVTPAAGTVGGRG